MSSTKTATLSLWASLALLVGFGMFIMKGRVQDLENELTHINHSISEDIKSIHILKAEWSHLNSPARLRTLSSKYAALNPARPEQIINYSAVPFKYENGESDRRLLARKNINSKAASNKELRKLAKASR